MTTNTARYALELFNVEDATYALRDATTGELVMMTSGEAVYAAPLENALWTADMMNWTASVTPEASPVAPEEMPEPKPERNDMDIAQAQRQRIKAAQERREARESVQPRELTDYPQLAGSAIGTVRVLLTHLNGLMRWLDQADTVTPEFWMEYMREQVAEARDYAANATEKFSAR